jgi:hypothetical protein
MIWAMDVGCQFGKHLGFALHFSQYVIDKQFMCGRAAAGRQGRVFGF